MLIVGMQLVELLSTSKSLNFNQITFYSLANLTWSVVHGREAQVYVLDNGRDYDKKMIKDHLNSIGVNLISWKELERNPNQIIGLGAITVLLHPEPQVYGVLKETVDYIVVSSSVVQYSSASSIVLEYRFNFSNSDKSIEKRLNHFNLRKGKAFI